MIYKIAKRIVDSKEKSKEKAIEKYKQEDILRRKAYENQQNLIASFAKRFTEELESEYEVHHKPKFKVGQKVLLHPYYPADGWEPSGYALFSHTEYKGPVPVIIDKIHVDSARVFEKIMDHGRDRDTFDQIRWDSQYDQFKSKVKNYILPNFGLYQHVMHQYSFHIPDTDHQCWRYAIREDKFLLPSSKAGRAALKMAATKEKINQAKIDLQKQKNEYKELYNLVIS